MFRVTQYVVKSRALLQRRPSLDLPFAPITRTTPFQYKRSKDPEREPCPKKLPECPPEPKDDRLFWSAMAVLVMAGSFAVYAKQNPEVRDWLSMNAPWFDDFIAIAYQENMTYLEFLQQCATDMKKALNDYMNKPKPCSLEENPVEIVEEEEDEEECEFGEEEEEEEEEENVCEIQPPPIVTNDICEIEACLKDLGSDVANNYWTAKEACVFYNDQVKDTMGNFSVNKLKNLHEIMAWRKELVDRSIDSATCLQSKLNALIHWMECGADVPKEKLDKTKEMIADLKTVITIEHGEFVWENDKALAYDKSWCIVERFIDQYIDEVKSLYPAVDYTSNTPSLGSGSKDVDFLVLHTRRLVLAMAEQVGDGMAAMSDRVDRAMTIGVANMDEKAKCERDKALSKEYSRRRGELDKEFQNRYTCLKADLDKMTKDALKAQQDQYEASLAVNIDKKEAEVQIRFDKLVAEKVAEEKHLMAVQLREMQQKLEVVETKLNERLKAEAETYRSRTLYEAGSSLLAATKRGEPFVKVDKELRAIEKATDENDKLVKTVLHAIPEVVWDRGVVPESVLRQKYHSMEKVALKVALIEKEGSPMPLYLLSWAQWALLFMKLSTIPQAEIDDPPKAPFVGLDTFDLLQRARYYVEQGNLAAALQYVGSLEGASRSAAATWHDAVRAHLETRQAAEAVLAHASALGLQYVQCLKMLGLVLIWMACTLCAIWLWRRQATRDTDHEPPAIPGALPLIGHAHLLIGDSAYLWQVIQDLTQQSIDLGGVISARIGPRAIYVVTDPDDALTIANSCLEKDGFYEFAKPWLGEGLVTGKLSVWKTHRKLLNPAFSQLVLDGFLGAFNRQARRLTEALAAEVGKGPFDHWTYTRHNALETICLTALGVDFTDSTLLNSKYVHATEEMFNVLVERFQNLLMHNHWMYSWTQLKKKQDRLLQILHSMAKTVLQRRKSIMNGEEQLACEKITDKKLGSKFKPFLDLLLELTEEKGAFNDQEIREQVDTMIVGGHDTSASVLMYTMTLIGSYPEVQEKLHREMDEVFGGFNREIDKRDLSQLVYTEAVIKEAMRVIPIVPVVARSLDRNIKLKNCTLAAGRTCFVFLYGINRHPVWGPDAQEFRPERWLDPASLPDHPNAFAGFSMGKRQCIGKAYALMSMKTSLAYLMREYKFKGDWTKLQLKLDVMLKPSTGTHHITVEKRE